MSQLSARPAQGAADSGMSSPNPKPVSDQQLAVAEKNYKLLKRKLKYLLYEQEALADDLRKCRRKVLRITKEKEYILDRLLRHEDVPTSEYEGSSASEVESDDMPLARAALAKRLAQEQHVKAPSSKKDKEKSKDKEKQTPGGEVKVKRKAKKKEDKETPAVATPKEEPHPPGKHKGSEKKGDPRCRAQPCKMKPLTGLKYCRKHAPLDPNSGFIYCTYREPQTKAQTCKAVVKRSMAIPLCPIHRRTRTETSSPVTALMASPAPTGAKPGAGDAAGDEGGKSTPGPQQASDDRDAADEIEDDVDDED